MTIVFVPMPMPEARALQAGGFDANGQPPERQVLGGAGTPCRHCLRDVPEGADVLVLAYRPFPAPQPYAEVGPIFLCADAGACEAPRPSPEPPVILISPAHIVRGYGVDHRIVYGTGDVIATAQLRQEAEVRLADPRVAYVHVRSAQNNCFQVRVERA